MSRATLLRVGVAAVVGGLTATFVALGRVDSTVVTILAIHSFGLVAPEHLPAVPTAGHGRSGQDGRAARGKRPHRGRPEANTGELISDVRRLGFTETFATDTSLGGPPIRT